MLDDCHGGSVEFGDQFNSGIGVVDIVVRQLLALMLRRGGDAGATRPVDIESRGLVRVLAVAQRLGQTGTCGDAAGRLLEAGHPGRDGGIIGGGPAIGDGRLSLAERQGGRAVVGIEFGQKGGVILGVGDDAGKGLVLGPGPDHGRPADIDVLDAGGVIRTRGHRCLERIEVHHQQVDRIYAMCLHRSHMFRVVAQRQQSAVDRRMQGLDPPVHHFGEARHFSYIPYCQPGIAQRLGGPSCRHKLHSAGGQSLPEVEKSGFVGHGDQGALQWHGRQGGCGHGISILGSSDLLGGRRRQVRRLLRASQGPVDGRGIGHQPVG